MTATPTPEQAARLAALLRPHLERVRAGRVSPRRSA
jgi:hypothetical protein